VVSEFRAFAASRATSTSRSRRTASCPHATTTARTTGARTIRSTSLSAKSGSRLVLRFIYVVISCVSCFTISLHLFLALVPVIFLPVGLTISSGRFRAFFGVNLLLNIIILNLLSLLFKFSLALERVQLFADLSWGFILMSMEDYITSADAFFNLDQLQLEPRSKLMKSDSYLGVLLFVLVIIREGDFRTRQIVKLTLRTIGACIALASENIVSYVIVLRKVGQFLFIYDFLDASVDSSLSCTDTVMSEFDFTILLLSVLFAGAFRLIEHHYSFASG